VSESLTAKVRRTHSPINRLAASVIGPGIRYEETFVPKNEIVSMEPLPIRPYPQFSNPDDNIAGRKFGRFTAIGLSTTTNSWVVKCACGRYCYRKAKVLKKTELEGKMTVMCPHCANVDSRKNGEGKRRDLVVSRLHAAALPMYRALERILQIGVTTSTRRQALDALAVANGSLDRSELPDMEKLA